jgi:hypothetical protein
LAIQWSHQMAKPRIIFLAEMHYSSGLKLFLGISAQPRLQNLATSGS